MYKASIQGISVDYSLENLMKMDSIKVAKKIKETKRNKRLKSADGLLSLNDCIDIMEKHCNGSGQKLIKYFQSEIEGNVVYYFYSLKKEMVNGNTYSCISMMTPKGKEILETDCNNSLIKVRQWNKLENSPKIYL